MLTGEQCGSPPPAIPRRATRRIATRQMPQACPPQRGSVQRIINPVKPRPVAACGRVPSCNVHFRRAAHRRGHWPRLYSDLGRGSPRHEALRQPTRRHSKASHHPARCPKPTRRNAGASSAATGRGFTVTSGVVHHAIKRFGSPPAAIPRRDEPRGESPPARSPSLPAATREWQHERRRAVIQS